VMDKNKPEKTPGSPLNVFCPFNKDLYNFSADIYEVVNYRLQKYEQLGAALLQDERGLFPTEPHKVAAALVDLGIVDPVLVGFKSEPRAIKDGQRKVPRLVSQVSVVTNMIQRLIFGDNQLEEQKYDNLPTATKLDITTPEITARMYADFKVNGPLSTSDVEGWEYSVDSRTRYENCCKLAWSMKLADDNMRPLLGKEKHLWALWGLYYCLVHRVVQTQEGELLIPPPGQESSGELGTFNENSFNRSHLSNKVSLDAGLGPVRYTKSAGDDNLDSNPDLREKYQIRGFKITDYAFQVEDFEFCSTQYSAAGCYQQNIKKYVYQFMQDNKDITDSLNLLEYARLFGNHPRKDEMLNMLVERHLLRDATASPTVGLPPSY